MNAPRATDVAWVSWLAHQRTDSIARHFGHDVKVLATKSRGAARYVRLILATTVWLLRARPSIVIVQCPSIVLAWLVIVTQALLRHRVVLDAHNEIVQNYNFPNSRIMRALYRAAIRRADLVVVTNPTLAQEVQRLGGEPVVLPDKLVARAVAGRRGASEPRRIVVISTFASDEPLEELVEAARVLGPSYRFRFTGRVNNRAARLATVKPEWVEFTGFLAEEDYWRLLEDSDLVVDLTLKPACLVCGAYEAISLRRPVLLSADREVMSWFGDAALYCRNERASIAEAIASALRSPHAVHERQAGSIVGIEQRWAELAREFADRLAALESPEQGRRRPSETMG